MKTTLTSICLTALIAIGCANGQGSTILKPNEPPIKAIPSPQTLQPTATAPSAPADTPVININTPDATAETAKGSENFMSRQSPELAQPAESAPTPTPTTAPDPPTNDDSLNEAEDEAALLERKKLRLINQITREFTQYLEETTGYTVKREDQIIEESEFNPTQPSNADTNKPDPGLFVITFFDVTETAPSHDLHGDPHEHAIECRSIIAIDYKNDVRAPIRLEAAAAENEAYAWISLCHDLGVETANAAIDAK